MRALTEVQGAVLSLVVTLVLLSSVISFDLHYIIPQTSSPQSPGYSTLEVLFVANNSGKEWIFL